MKPKHPLLQKCLVQLEALPHLEIETEIEAEPYMGKIGMADGQIQVHSPQGSVTYVVEIKSDGNLDIPKFCALNYYWEPIAQAQVGSFLKLKMI